MSARDRTPFRALDDGDWFQFYANDKPKCPHCGEDFDIRENEAWHLYSEDGPHGVECQSCDLGFQVNSSATWCFSTAEQERDDA